MVMLMKEIPKGVQAVTHWAEMKRRNSQELASVVLEHQRTGDLLDYLSDNIRK